MSKILQSIEFRSGSELKHLPDPTRDGSDAIDTRPRTIDREIVITGASSGIGRATALAFAAEGASLHLVDIDADGLATTSTKAAALGAASTVIHEVDVSSEDSVEELANDLTSLSQGIAVLANIAGIGVRAKAVETTRPEWDRVIGVNLTGTFLMCKHLIPQMTDNGVIVNVASVAGLVGITNRAAYCASKAGIVGLTKSIAVDYGPEGIRAVAVCPGTVETEWIDRILDGVEDRESARQAMASRQLDGRLGTPEEIAATIAFVASDAGRFFNGSTLVVDGGMTA